MTTLTLFAAVPGAEAAETVKATGPASAALWLILLPALSAALLLLLGRRADRWGHLLGVVAPVASCVLGFVIAIQLLGLDSSERLQHVDVGSWIDAGALNLRFGLLVDPLSVTFVMLITFVGSLIHIYSVAYMEHDINRRRFFAYLNLFVAAMLTLVLADSFLLLFFGWEGVGLASYLLIGFWNHEVDHGHKVGGATAMENSVASKKAFVANRVGDLGMIVAMGLLFAQLGTVAFHGRPGTHEAGVFDLVGHGDLSTAMATGIGLMLLLAACGKSAQFPLQSWLGDAMAGPTPVSALIHAATMVTAGVYLVVRSQPLFDQAPNARLVVAIVGAVTLLYGAIVGCAKDDIKKALAASTMSQIGYMMLAAGLGPVGYAIAIVHLVGHGFFKAGMFLGAGSVMHAMDDEVNMRKFGNLGRRMMFTYVTFGMGWLAIIGFPGLTGFFTKDSIIEAAFSSNAYEQSWQPYVFGTVTMVGAALTAFYMSRLFFMTFEGRARWEPGTHPHESPRLMTWPMVVLAVGSLGFGAFFGKMPWSHWNGRLSDWLAPSVGHPHEHATPVVAWPIITFGTMILVGLALWLAWTRFGSRAAQVPREAPPASPLVVAARKDLYQDEVNNGLLVIPGTYATRALVFTDGVVVDGAVRGVARGAVAVGDQARRPQTGFVRQYAATMAIGVVVLIIIVLAAQII
ncbi:MAG: NADH-quinone oxidoreductase subunit L [Micrococcales bacterium]|nr:NADH-quinone oxidoreductase subunit L [Micrococcales bacterium]MCL2666570.1 NADH-quinone oxidoreductase subunit L [Micrococcales bacterium]